MEIDAEQLVVPEIAFQCTIRMPSNELQRIARDIQVLGDTCKISCTKEGIRFSVSGDMGTGNFLKQATANSNAKRDEDHVVIDME